MRVLHIIPSICRKRGGPSKAVIEMVKALRMKNIDASIVTTTDNAPYRESGLPINEWFFYQDVPILMFPCIQWNNKTLDEFLICPRMTKWLLENAEKYDIFHIHAIFSYPSTMAMVVARIKRVPYIIRTIGQLDRWSLEQGFIKKRLMLLLVEKSNLKSAVFIHVTSQQEADQVFKVVNQIRSILNLALGVELPTKTSNRLSSFSAITANSIRFIFLSRLHPKKQLDILLKAFYDLVHKYEINNWILYIAGDGSSEYVEKMKQMSKELSLDKNLKWLGHLSGNRKNEILESMDWFVLPSASENFGIAAVESLALGVPVIITPAVGIADAVKEYGAGLVCEAEADKLASVLKKAMLGSPHSMRLAAKKLALEKYSWDNISAELIKYYSLVLNIFKQK